MKKLYVFFAFLFTFLLPLSAMAAVDIAIDDTSSNEEYSVSVSIDTGIDTLDTLVLPIEFSDNVVITDVLTGSVICSKFDFVENNNILTITCELDTPSSLNAVLANIEFTSTSDEYSFKVLDDNSSLDIGGLGLGAITNIGSTETTTNRIATEEIDAIPINEKTEDDFLVTSDQPVEETASSTEGIMTFLPYILIGGSVVLLITILAIIFSKKGTSKKSEYIPVENPTPQDSTVPVQNEENTLKDMVNNTATPIEETPIPTPPVQDTPAPVMPTIQETPAPTMPPMEEIPISSEPLQQAQPTTEEQDLEEILRSENSTPVEPMGMPSNTPPVQPMDQPVIHPEAMQPQTMETVDVSSQPQPSPEDMLSNNVARELNQMQDTGSGIDLQGGMQEPVEPQPTQGFDTPQGGEVDQQEESMPPIPPTM